MALDDLFHELKGVDVSKTKALAELPFLNACINETLRLYPALMTGGNRMTTENGMMVAGKWIPPLTNIVAPQYIISRSAYLPFKTQPSSLWVMASFVQIHLPRFLRIRLTCNKNEGEDCFVRPLEFVPERWSTAPEMVLNPSATKPFGTGHTSCVGRPLAIDALRLSVAWIVRKYNFSYAPGEDGSGMGAGLKDQFVPNPGGLQLCFAFR